VKTTDFLKNNVIVFTNIEKLKKTKKLKKLTKKIKIKKN